MKPQREITIILKNLGNRLHKWRQNQKIRLVQLSELTGTRESTFSEIENGKSLPSLETLARIHKNTNMNIIWLIFDHGSMIKAENEKMRLKNPEIKNLHKALERILMFCSQEKKATVKEIINEADPAI